MDRRRLVIKTTLGGDANNKALKSEFRPGTKEIFPGSNEQPKDEDGKEQERIAEAAKAAFFDILDTNK